MEWINDLQKKTVGLDTAPLIYFIEENSAYIETVRFFFEAMDRGDFLVVTQLLLYSKCWCIHFAATTENWQLNIETYRLIPS